MCSSARSKPVLTRTQIGESSVSATSAGLLRFIGVCVPWRDAHVRTGRRDRAPWADHLAYLRELADILAATKLENTVLLGDFNRTFPASGARAEASALLTRIETLGLRFITSGLRGDGRRRAIDHISVGSGITASSVSVISNSAEPKRLSDHIGIAAALAPAARTMAPSPTESDATRSDAAKTLITNDRQRRLSPERPLNTFGHPDISNDALVH